MEGNTETGSILKTKRERKWMNAKETKGFLIEESLPSLDSDVMKINIILLFQEKKIHKKGHRKNMY
jgi:hypothetical protein